MDAARVFSGRIAGYGNVVRLLHEDPPPTEEAGEGAVSTNFAHLHQRLVDTGQRVSAGEAIGLVGTERAGPGGPEDVGGVVGEIGPHLHFSVQRVPEAGVERFSSRYEERTSIRIHPERWLNELGVAVTGSDDRALERYEQRRQRQEERAEQVQRSLALPEEVHPAARYFGGARRLEAAMVDRLLQDLFAVPVRTPQEFVALAADGAPRMVPAGRGLLYTVMPAIQAYAAVRRELGALPESKGPLAAIRSRLEEELSRLVPQNFISLYAAARMAHLERYLQALAIRARRALVDPEKDRAKSERLQAFSGRLHLLLKALGPNASAGKRRALEELFWMIEEYKVSIFAQELKTAVPVSAKRLEEKFGEVERMA